MKASESRKTTGVYTAAILPGPAFMADEVGQYCGFNGGDGRQGRCPTCPCHEDPEHHELHREAQRPDDDEAKRARAHAILRLLFEGMGSARYNSRVFRTEVTTNAAIRPPIATTPPRSKSLTA